MLTGLSEPISKHGFSCGRWRRKDGVCGGAGFSQLSTLTWMMTVGVITASVWVRQGERPLNRNVDSLPGVGPHEVLIEDDV